MSDKHLHTAHPNVLNRLKRAHGHLQNVIAMMENKRACMDIAEQLHAVERPDSAAKKLVIHDHLDHCLEEVVGLDAAHVRASIAEFKDITKYLQLQAPDFESPRELRRLQPLRRRSHE